jgi:hypothetical protein
VAIVFAVLESSDNRLCVEASAPLSSSVSVTKEVEEENTKQDRKEENKGNEDTEEEPTNKGSRRQKKPDC